MDCWSAGPPLAEEALTAGNAANAYRLASEMLVRDSCGEPACEIALRALSALGHSATAQASKELCALAAQILPLAGVEYRDDPFLARFRDRA